MTHNTREVEEVINEFKEKRKSLFTRGGLSVLLDYEPHDIVLDEKSVIDWLRTTLNHQLQKARQDWLREIEEVMRVDIGDASPTRLALQALLYRYQEELNKQ